MNPKPHRHPRPDQPSTLQRFRRKHCYRRPTSPHSPDIHRVLDATMGNSQSHGYSEFVSSDNHRRGRSSHRRRRSGSHSIPPAAPSPPPAYHEYPVPRSPPRTTRTTPGGYTYTTRDLSPIRERRPSPIRRTSLPPSRREPRRIYVTRTRDDPDVFMTGARLPSSSPPPERRAGAASPPRRRVYVDDPFEGPSSRAGGPSTFYDRPDTNSFRPRRDFDTGFGIGAGPSYTRSGGGGLHERPRRTFFSSGPSYSYSYSAGPSNRYRDQHYPGSGYRPDRGSWYAHLFQVLLHHLPPHFACEFPV